MDLLEQTRMKDVYKDITSIIDSISELPVGQPLVWVWVWDIAKQIHEDMQGGGEPEYCLTMDIEEMWELFWTQADKNGFSLTYGDEALYESVRDWMIDQEIIEEYEEEEDE